MHADWLTLRELDETEGRPKGSAFRAFKRVARDWREDEDFCVLHHGHDRETVDRLRSEARIYASTVNLLLLSPSLAIAVRDQMRRMTTDPAE
jgi:hypothetical protein